MASLGLNELKSDVSWLADTQLLIVIIETKTKTVGVFWTKEKSMLLHVFWCNWNQNVGIFSAGGLNLNHKCMY